MAVRAANLDEVAERFGVPCWQGPYTRTFGRWSEVAAGGVSWKLSVRELAMAIATPDGWPWP